ncbi:MAG: SDR family NAD(P)-dependent oxidoreductase [Chloroflexota bacterium]
MELGLNGKVAIVTGGSEGIGKAAALSLASEGAKVAIAARRQDALDAAVEEIKQSSGNQGVMGLSTDVTDQQQVQRLIDIVVGTWGGLDILVNNAGTSNAHVFDQVPDEIWNYDVNLKVFGAIYCSRAAIPHMKQRGGGRIVNITTPGGKAAAGGSLPTSMSRAAGIALTKAMSKDYAADNILVNTVCIGLIKSGQHERRWQAAHEKNPSLTLEQWYQQMGERVPLGRVGEAREAGDLICWLASERASYVTGTAINVDGGTSAVV